MESISETKRIPDREIFYQRARTQNRIFDKLVTFFAERAEDSGITKRDIADRLGRDPAQITRWLSSPSNITIDTISDLLLALEAELDATVHGFADRPTANYTHPWMEEYWEAGKPSPGVRSKRAGALLIGDLNAISHFTCKHGRHDGEPCDECLIHWSEHCIESARQNIAKHECKIAELRARIAANPASPAQEREP